MGIGHAMHGYRAYAKSQDSRVYSTMICTTVPLRTETMMSLLRARWYIQFDTPTFACRPFSLMTFLLLNLRCGLPHFFISTLTESPVFTIFLPHLKLSAEAVHDRLVSMANKSKARIFPGPF